MAEVREYKTKKGTTYFVDYRIDGRRVRKTVGSSKKLAEQIAKDIEVKIIKESSDLYVKDISVEEFFHIIEEYNTTNLRARTAVRYKNVIDNLKEFLGDRIKSKLSGITITTLEDYKTHSKKTHKDGTINTEIKILRTIFNHAVRWKYMRSNPATDTKTIKENPKIPDAYSENEIERIIENTPHPFDDIFRLFLQTGMRRDELRFLEVRDVLFDRGLIHIRAKEGFIPKTAEGFIPITSEAREILQRHCKLAVKGLVFKNPEGNAYYPRMFLDVIKRAAKRANIDNATVHRLRHSFCTHLLALGVDIEIIRQLARHSNIKTTQRYLHVRAEHLQKSVEMISGLGKDWARTQNEKEKAAVTH